MEALGNGGVLKRIRVFSSLDSTNSVGWAREDLPLIHVFAQAKPGEAFQPSNGNGGPHWPCAVCDAHGYTPEMFHAQMLVLMETPS